LVAVTGMNGGAETMKSTYKSGLVLALSAAALALPSAMAVAAETAIPAEVRQDFERADQDRDGYLSGKEGLDYVGTSLRLDDLAFKAADTNGDGRLSPEEFASYAKAARAKPMPAPPVYRRTPYSY
jgi:hypothetical protein